MASITDRLLHMLPVILTITSSALSELPMNEPHLYDKTCFVPPSQRPININKLVLFDLSSLPSYPSDYLAIPNGTCGVEIYYYIPGLYLLPQYQDYIKSTASMFWQFCTENVNSELTVTPFQMDVLTSGSIDGVHPGKPLVPPEELKPVPIEWRRGLVTRFTFDPLAAGKLDIRCTVPVLQPVPDSVYNLNMTIQINGCPWDKYGSRCEHECSCAEGVECHSFNGVCMCPTGLQGANCDQREPQLASRQQVYVPYGGSANLTCFMNGVLPGNWSWFKDGHATPLQISSQEMDVLYRPRPVVITTTVHAHDTSINGGYTCEVHDESGTILRQHANVTVIAIPDPIVQVPWNHTALTGSNVTFTCQIKREAGTVRWVKGRNQPPSEAAEIKEEVGRYEILQPSPGVSQLRIDDVEFADEDVYRCYAGHIFRVPDLSYAEAMLTVLSFPQPACSFQDVISVPSGDPLTLWCYLNQAKPIPVFTWTVVCREMSPEPVVTPSDDELSFNVASSVTFVPSPEDDRKRINVTVTSAAQLGSQELTALLNVTYTPIVTVSPDPITLTTGQDATVKCDAQANPKPTNYVWTLTYSNQSAFNIPFGSGRVFVFKNISKEYDNASLTCLVRNTIGETKMTVQIKVTDIISTTGVTIGVSVFGGLCLAVLVLASFLARRYRKEIRLWKAKKAGKDRGDKEYDVFISYKSGTADEEFVVRDLIPRLEQDGYHVCIHYRSFLPGKSIIDNIADAVHSSRKTLILLSPGYVESEWCRYEFQAALSQMLHLQSDLIPVIFEDLGPPDDLSPDLQTILRTLSYITWPGAVQRGHYQTEEDRERFWKLLWQSLPETPLRREEQEPGTPLGSQLEHVCETPLSPRDHTGGEYVDVNNETFDISSTGENIFLMHA